MTVPRRFPLPLRHMHSFGGCVRFARAISEHPCCEGGEVLDLMTSNVARRTTEIMGTDKRIHGRVSPADAWIHTFVRRPDGSCVDVNGAASFEGVCAAYGLDPAECRAVPSRRHLHPANEDGAAELRAIADLLGWDERVPRSPGTPDFMANLDEAYRLARRHDTGSGFGCFPKAYLIEMRERTTVPAGPAP